MIRAHFARALSWDGIGRRALEIYGEVARSLNGERGLP